jgi:hypothetical protein
MNVGQVLTKFYILEFHYNLLTKHCGLKTEQQYRILRMNTYMRLCARKCLDRGISRRGIPRSFTEIKGHIVANASELLRSVYFS